MRQNVRDLVQAFAGAFSVPEPVVEIGAFQPSDFWRFTPAAFRLLLEGFAFSLVGFQGDSLKPHTIVGVGARAAPPPREAVEAFVARTPGTRWA